jgi:hypothetical protein
LKVIPDNITGVTMTGADLIIVNGIRESDGKLLDMTNRFLRTSPLWGEGFSEEETIVQLNWGDFYNGNSEVYNIHLQSPLVFGNNETHTLKWYIRGSGNSYNAYKCEFDGMEIALENDPIYIKSSRGDYHAVKALITINTHI